MTKIKYRQKKHNKKRTMKGGSITTFVGAPLIYKNIDSWPGVTGAHGGNHYAYNHYPTDPYTGNIIQEDQGPVYPPHIMKGGYNYKNRKSKRSKGKFIGGFTYKDKDKRRSRKKHKGGAFPLWNDASNYISRLTTQMSNNYNTLQGLPQTPSAAPYANQFGYK